MVIGYSLGNKLSESLKQRKNEISSQTQKHARHICQGNTTILQREQA